MLATTEFKWLWDLLVQEWFQTLQDTASPLIQQAMFDSKLPPALSLWKAMPSINAARISLDLWACVEDFDRISSKSFWSLFVPDNSVYICHLSDIQGVLLSRSTIFASVVTTAAEELADRYRAGSFSIWSSFSLGFARYAIGIGKLLQKSGHGATGDLGLHLGVGRSKVVSEWSDSARLLSFVMHCH